MIEIEKKHCRRYVVVLFATATLLAINCGGVDPCGNDVLSDVPSPNGSHHAVVFERDCGATTGFTTQVSIVGRGEVVRERSSFWTATEKGNVLIVDDNHGAAPQGPGGGPNVDVTWRGEHDVLLTYHSRARVALAVERIGDTRITHQRAE